MRGFDEEGEIWRFGPFRPKIFVLTSCQGLEIRDIGFRQAPFWGLHKLGCEHVRWIISASAITWKYRIATA